MDARAAMKQIKNGESLPVYLCWGKESFFVNEFVQYLIDKVIDEEHREFSVTKYRLSETPLTQVIEDAETFPFLVPRKVVIAHEALFFTGAKEKGKAEHDLERLMAYLQNPVDHTILVFVVDAEKLDERKKIVKMIKDLGADIAFGPLNANELSTWIATRAQRLGFRLEDSAADYLALNNGTQLQQLQTELEKLSAYAGNGGTVSLGDVEQLVARSAEQNVFKLIEEIVHMRTSKAMAIFYDLIRQKEEPIKLLALIVSQYRRILQTKELAGRGYSHQQIASQLGSHPYAVKVAEEQSRKYTFERLGQVLDQLADLDYRMKTGKIDKLLGMEMLLLRLAK